MSGPLKDVLQFCVRGEIESAVHLIEEDPSLSVGAWNAESFELSLPGFLRRSISRGDTVLIAACLGQPGPVSVKLVEALIAHGANVNACNLAGWDALIFASNMNNLPVVNALISNGAQINRENQKSSALHWASRRNYPEICLALLKHGADLFATHAGGLNPLQEYGVDSWVSPGKRRVLMEQLVLAFRSGPHHSQVQRRKDETWIMRWPLMSVVASSGFRPLATKLASLKIEEGPIPVIVLDTPEKYVAYRRALVFSNDGLLRLIVSYL